MDNTNNNQKIKSIAIIVLIVFALLILLILMYVKIEFSKPNKVEPARSKSLEKTLSTAPVKHSAINTNINTIKKHKVILNSDQIIICYTYKAGSSFYIKYSKCGPNSIMAIDSIYFLPDNNSSINGIINNSSKPFMKSETDWIGPIVVKSNLISNICTPQFTGGWHNFKSLKGKYKPTARTLDYDVFADGIKVSQGDTKQCDTVKIEVTNLIEGYNTLLLSPPMNEMLKENVTYTIYSDRVDVSVQFQALVDATISTYYGLQTQNLPWSPGTIIYENGEGDTRSISINSSSGKKSEYPYVNSYIIHAIEGNCDLSAWIDRFYELGEMNYVGNEVPCAFTECYKKVRNISNSKSYFNLINGIPCKLQKGQETGWRGGYIFFIDTKDR